MITRGLGDLLLEGYRMKAAVGRHQMAHNGACQSRVSPLTPSWLLAAFNPLSRSAAMHMEYSPLPPSFQPRPNKLDFSFNCILWCCGQTFHVGRSSLRPEWMGELDCFCSLNKKELILKEYIDGSPLHQWRVGSIRITFFPSGIYVLNFTTDILVFLSQRRFCCHISNPLV